MPVSEVAFGEAPTALFRARYVELFGGATVLRRVRSQPVEVDVAPIPASEAPSTWLPAKSVQLVESWPDQPPTIAPGEPLTRTIAMVADGLMASQLPALHGPIPDGLKHYPDRPMLQDQESADGIVATRQEKFAIIPTRPGEYELPAIEVNWWDTASNTRRFARLPERRIIVSASAQQSGLAPPPTPEAASRHPMEDLSEAARSAPKQEQER